MDHLRLHESQHGGAARSWNDQDQTADSRTDVVVQQIFRKLDVLETKIDVLTRRIG